MTLRILVPALLLAAAGAAAQPAAGPCDAPENAQFDFWVGTWEVHAQGRLVGRNTIARVHGGCTLLEQYASEGGFTGTSLNWYDPVGGHWHQVWTDSAGTRLHLVGDLEDGAMVLAGDRATVDGPVRDRITWTPQEDGTVRQHWEQSMDDGATWATVFDGTYRKADG